MDKQGRLVAAGHTARGGRPHAETTAPAMVGMRRGVAVPMSHLNPSRTSAIPVWLKALIAAGIAVGCRCDADQTTGGDGRGVDLLAPALSREDAGAMLSVPCTVGTAQSVNGLLLH